MNPRALKPDAKRNLRPFAFIACLSVLADPLGEVHHAAAYSNREA
jgi:hypothetical protein